MKVISPRMSIANLGEDTNWKYHIRIKPKKIAASSLPFYVYELNGSTKPRYPIHIQDRNQQPFIRSKRPDTRQAKPVTLLARDGKSSKPCLSQNILHYYETSNTTFQPVPAPRVTPSQNFDSSKVQSILNCAPKNKQDPELVCRRLRNSVVSSSLHKVFNTCGDEDTKTQTLLKEMMNPSRRGLKSSRSEVASILDGSAENVWKPSRRLSRQALHTSQFGFQEDPKVRNRQMSSLNFNSKSSLFGNDIVHVSKKRGNLGRACSKEIVYRPSVKCKRFDDVRNPITGECISYT